MAHRCNVTTFYWHIYLKNILLIIDLSFSVLITFLLINLVINEKNILKKHYTYFTCYFQYYIVVKNKEKVVTYEQFYH